MSSPDSWIVRPRSSSPEARLQLLVFPYAGGGPAAFRAWQDRLTPGVRVFVASLPGRERRIAEKPLDDMATIVEQLTAAACAIAGNGIPIAFFGYSLGGIIAFEVARRLSSIGCPSPSSLIVAACAAPQLPWRRPMLHLLDDEQLVGRLRDLNGTPEDVLRDPEMLQLFLPMLRADFKLRETYRYMVDRPLPIPISAIGGARDPYVTRDDVDAWREQTTERFDCTIFDGGHFLLKDFDEALRCLVLRAMNVQKRTNPSPSR